MARYRNNLPQLGGEFFLTDGGIETTLIFREGLELPYFAAFDLLKHTEGTAALRKYFQTYAEMARRYESAAFSRAQPGAPAWIGIIGMSRKSAKLACREEMIGVVE